MLPENFPYRIVLGSRSPRRKELLSGLGVNFTVDPTDADETFDAQLSPEVIAESLAEKKAMAWNKFTSGELYITCDTLVFASGKVLNKPADVAEAGEMLRILSGTAHQVFTGVCLRTKNKKILFHEVTNVYFRPLSEEMILYYISRCKPFDKAGGYGIQEWIGFAGIEKIEGCYFNVVGLPLSRLWHELQSF